MNPLSVAQRVLYSLAGQTSDGRTLLARYHRLKGPVMAMPATVRRLVDATRDYLDNGGAHDGPCANDPNEVGACSHHLTALAEREQRLKLALQAVEADYGN